ncbi:MAG: hypothetical protein R2852_05865 [Bacteroidia bacterium]
MVLNHYFVLDLGGGNTKRCSVQYPDTSFGEPEFFIEVFAYDTTTLKADPIRVCIGDTVTFTGNIKPEDRYTFYKWNYGASATDTLVSPDTITKHAYDTAGFYTLNS